MTDKIQEALNKANIIIQNALMDCEKSVFEIIEDNPSDAVDIILSAIGGSLAAFVYEGFDEESRPHVFNAISQRFDFVLGALENDSDMIIKQDSGK